MEIVSNTDSGDLLDSARGVEELLDGLGSVSDYLQNKHCWISYDDQDGSYQLAKKEDQQGVTSYSLMYTTQPDSNGMIESHQYTWGEEYGGYIFLKCPERDIHKSSIGAYSEYKRGALDTAHIRSDIPHILSIFFNAETGSFVYNGAATLQIKVQ